MKQYNTDGFTKDLVSLDIHLSDRQLMQFMKYYEMLVEWNRIMNLTSITVYTDVIKKHFVDSLSLVKAYDITKFSTVIDVGTGAGFPGLALKIAYPDLNVTLLDSLNKRIQFLDTVIEELEINGVETIHGRAEDCAKSEGMREQFDLCVSRAVANLSTLAEYCIPFVKQEGLFISYKSEKNSEEILAAENAVFVLGGKIERQMEFILPNSDIYRNLVVIRKERSTPEKYPRKAGLPKKEPL